MEETKEERIQRLVKEGIEKAKQEEKIKILVREGIAAEHDKNQNVIPPTPPPSTSSSVLSSIAVVIALAFIFYLFVFPKINLTDERKSASPGGCKLGVVDVDEFIACTSKVTGLGVDWTSVHATARKFERDCNNGVRITYNEKGTYSYSFSCVPSTGVPSTTKPGTTNSGTNNYDTIGGGADAIHREDARLLAILKRCTDSVQNAMTKSGAIYARNTCSQANADLSSTGWHSASIDVGVMQSQIGNIISQLDQLIAAYP